MQEPTDFQIPRPNRLVHWLGLLALLLSVTAVCVPCVTHGFPRGDDLDFHAALWNDLTQQWHQGTLYPRWANDYARGFGQPVYVFYPPLSLALGAAATQVVGIVRSPLLLGALVVLLAGLAMRRCAAEFVDERAAWIAACLYAANPYFVLSLWIRNAFAELLAAALFPLLVLYAWRLRNARGVAPLALTYAAIWLTNLPAAVIAIYAIAVLLVVKVVRERSWLTMVWAVLAALLGAGLAGFFLVPAAYERRWVDIAKASTSYFTYSKHFLFQWRSDLASGPFYPVISTTGLMIVTALVVFCVLACVWKCERWKLLPLGAMVALMTLLMCDASESAWPWLPVLKNVQFPWRCMFVTSFGLALAAGLAAQRWRKFTMLLAILSAFGAGLYLYGQTDWADLWPPNAERVLHNPPILDEYLPKEADSKELAKASSTRAELIERNGSEVVAAQWSGERRFTISSRRPALLRLRLLNYPAWRVTVNEREVVTRTNQDTGQMEIPVDSGTNRIELQFARTRDQLLGAWVSVICALILLLLVLQVRAERPRNRDRLAISSSTQKGSFSRAISPRL